MNKNSLTLDSTLLWVKVQLYIIDALDSSLLSLGSQTLAAILPPHLFKYHTQMKHIFLDDLFKDPRLRISAMKSHLWKKELVIKLAGMFLFIIVQ